MTKEKEYVISKIRKLKGRKFKALLGMGDSGNTVAVEGKADFVWIRLKYGSALAPPVEALNRHVPPIHGRLVTVQEREAAGQKGFEVIDWAGITYYHDDTTYEDLPAHGWTHESGPGEGSDPVNLYTRGWAELRVEPTVPCSMQAYVTYGWYLFDVPTWFNGGNTPTFVPPAIGSRMDLVYLDSSGTVGIEEGLFAIIPATPVVPEPPDYTIPLAAIELTGTTGCITDDMILDCRVMPNVKGPILFDDSIQPEVVEAGFPCWPGGGSEPARRDHRHHLVEPLELLDGTADAPSYSFASEPTLGFWRRGPGEVGLNDSLWVGDHVRMATGTCTGDFNVGGDVTIAGSIPLTFIADVWEDLRVPVTSTKVGGNDPGFAVFKTDGAGSRGVFIYWFDKNAEEELFFTVQLSHSWREGSNIYPHVHWIPAANGGADEFVQWGLEYTWANIDAVYGNTTLITVNTTTSGDNPLVADTHYVSSFGAISGTGQAISSMLACRVYRDATDPNDDYDDDAGLLEIDFHYLRDTVGSQNRLTK